MLPYQKVVSKSLIACVGVCVHSVSQDLSQVPYVGSVLLFHE